MTSIATTYYYVNGVLNDDTVTSVTLSDAGATYGIRRVNVDGTYTTMLAAAAATAHPSEGTYTYDYTALALDSSYNYQVSFKIVDSLYGTTYQVELIQAADQSRTLAGYRQSLARRLGRWGAYTTSSAGSSTSELVCASLADSDKESSAYNAAYAYLTSGALSGIQRRVKSGGYANGTGALTMSRAFGSTPAISVSFELLFRLPATDQDDARGLHSCINEALQSCWLIDRLSFTGAVNDHNYSLTSYPWLRRPEQIGQLYGPVTDATLDNPPPWGGGVRLRLDGEAPLLEIAGSFAATDTFYLDVLRPANTRIKSTGAWGESTAGLVSDSDEALIDDQLLTEVALAYAYTALADLGGPSEQDGWKMKAREQALTAVRMKERMLPKLPANTAGRSYWAGTKNLFGETSGLYW